MSADKKAHPLVTKEVMLDYEKLRKSGAVNMRDRNAVYTAAHVMELEHLAALMVDDIDNSARDSVYVFEIIKRYDFYMDKFKLVR